VIYAIIQFESVAITVKTARCRRKLQWVPKFTAHRAVVPAIAWLLLEKVFRFIFSGFLVFRF